MPSTNQRGDAVPVSRVEYPDATVLAADFGPGAIGSVDLVDDVAIVVLERGGETVQREIDLPERGADEADPRVFMNNGVLTVEVDA